jgi:hypothetical protein
MENAGRSGSSPLRRTLIGFILPLSVLSIAFGFKVFLLSGRCAVNGRLVIGFALIFAIFYIVLLAFDCLYFVRVEKKINKTESE